MKTVTIGSLALLLCASTLVDGRASFSKVHRIFPNTGNSFPKNGYRPSLQIRGGSTTVAPADSDAEATRQYRVQQQLLLQSRSVALRQALIARGLDALQFTTTETEQAKPTDWDCAMASAESPKSCLYSFDAELGRKVVAPRGTDQWITLTALNRLRRTDPSKVEPLWHSQYAILQAWFHPTSPHSLYTYLSPRAALLSFILDVPMALGVALAVTMSFLFLLTFPIWETLLTTFLTSSVLWLQWPNWARFVHAAFPLKLLLGQMAWKAIASALGKLHGRVRNELIEMECQLWEECMPRTIIEGNEEESDEEEDLEEDLDEDIDEDEYSDEEDLDIDLDSDDEDFR
mmetsp:Transcript_5869/g.12361  ORF Transcript_5869/g.12361 Transcript_5869/m.12361 type:complete len:345 (-) Transcript_5869:147-1181(-)